MINIFKLSRELRSDWSHYWHHALFTISSKFRAITSMDNFTSALSVFVAVTHGILLLLLLLFFF